MECKRLDLHTSNTSNNCRFRYAQLVLSYIQAQRTVRTIRQAMGHIPETLNTVYESILSRVPVDDKVYVRRALMWLSFSDERLSLEELSEAVVLEEDLTSIGKDDRLQSLDFLPEVAQGIIAFDDGYASLAHSSVKTFLTSEWIKTSNVKYYALDEDSATSKLMRLCLTYLLFTDFKTVHFGSQNIGKQYEQFPLLYYAVNYWPIHALQLSSHDYKLVDRFFQTRNLPQGGNFTYWVWCLIPTEEPSRIQETQPLYYASSFGLVSIVDYLLKTDPEIDVDALGGRFRSTPLIVASYRGHTEVVKLLLRAGADPAKPDIDGWNALQWAQNWTWTEIEHLLQLRLELTLEEFRVRWGPA